MNVSLFYFKRVQVASKKKARLLSLLVTLHHTLEETEIENKEMKQKEVTKTATNKIIHS
jgi:hypothetical protein